jgi:Na+/melibiose symporter-like transporter
MTVAAALIFMTYRLTGARHAEILEELKVRRASRPQAAG